MAESSKSVNRIELLRYYIIISGIVFIILGIVTSIIVGVATSRIVIYLPIGIALLIVGIGIWQKSRNKMKENDSSNSSEVN